MEEGRWAARLLSEVGSARAAIAASYLNLWRTSAGLPDSEQEEPPPVSGQLPDEPSAPSTTTLDETERA